MSVLELDLEADVGGRTIRAGDLVKIDGFPYARVGGIVDGRRVSQRGWRVLGFRDGAVHVFGARTPRRVEMLRTFSVDLIVLPRRRAKAG